MKKILTLIFTATTLMMSCGGNNPQNKIDATDSQAVSQANGVTLTVDTTASTINWVGFKTGGSHHGTIAIKEGSIVVAADSSASGSFTIDMNAIIDKDLTDDTTNKMLVNHLKSPDFFDVAKYPESKFAITKIESVKNDTITHLISGNLKMKDIEKNITFGANISKDGDTYKAVTIPFTIDRTQWKVEYGSKTIFADLKDKIIDDNIQLQITIVAKPNK